MEHTAVRDVFNHFAKQSAVSLGSPLAFLFAILVVVVWIMTGPVFEFSNTWQLVINTGTTIVTFLMVFLIQNTQNRDSKVLQLKLDELIHGIEGARNRLIDLENCSEEELDHLQRQFERLRKSERTQSKQE